MSQDPEASGPGGAPDRPHPIYNWMSGIGATLAAVSLTAVAFLAAVETFTRGETGYGGLFLLPPLGLVFVGLGLLVAGWLRERRRQQRGEQSSFFETFVVDPWATVRRVGPLTVLAIFAGGALALLTAGAGTLGLVHYSESNTFCTDACHTIMSPEGAVWEQSPHARIDCVECHVVPGAAGFLEAKLGGMRQLWGAVTGDVPKPIPTPVHGDVLGRELCERCHAPEQDAGYKALTRTYYPSGEETFGIPLAMVVKVGGGGRESVMPGDGIHYHMQVADKVEYIARDDRRMDVAWIRVTDRNGGVREFAHDSRPLDAEERAQYAVRTMDCIDCHNRVGHRFPPPTETVNEALQAGMLSVDVPGIKLAAVQALDGGYASTPEALEGIEEALRGFYDDEYPDFAEDEPEAIDETVDALRDLYTRTIFPEMQADWTAHPDHGNHLQSPGCFRCHNQEMVDEGGEAVFDDCSGCHAVLAQGGQAIETMAEFDEGTGFVHPEDWGTFDEFSLCSDCHTGGAALYE